MGAPLGIGNNQAGQIWWPQFLKIVQQSSILATTLLSVVTINNVDFLLVKSTHNNINTTSGECRWDSAVKNEKKHNEL